LGLTGGLLLLEARFLRGLRFDRSGTGISRKFTPTSLGKWTVPAYLFVGSLALLAVVLPVLTVGHWMIQGTGGQEWARMAGALWASVSASAPAALLCGLLALPI